MNLKEMLAEMLRSKASDLHLRVGLKPILRIDGILHPIETDLISLEDMDRILNQILTEEQKTQLKPIIENKMNEMRALRMDQSLDPEEKEGRLASMQDSYRSQIQSVLTSAQIQKLAELREKRRLASQETLTQKRKGKVPIDDEDQ